MSFLHKPTIFMAENFIKKALKSQLQIKPIKEFKSREKPEDKSYLLYAHIPFCHTFCPFCSFHKFKYEKPKVKEYFKNLRLEMQKVKAEGFCFDTIYFGGGTTLIDEDELIKTLELAKKLFDVDEISCESDPDISQKSILRLKGLVKRLSIGIQSFDDEILKKMGRFQKFGNSQALIEKLEPLIGVLPILSLDLIFNLPLQTENSLLKDIEIVKNLNPEQITFYPLMSSSLMQNSIKKALGSSTLNNEYKFYKIITQEFATYHQNNAWSFSKQNCSMSDEYNANHNEYIGIGSGAFSFLKDNLYINTFNLENYAQNIQKHGSSYMAYCKFEQIYRIKYLFLNALFDGAIDISKFNAKHNVQLEELLKKEIQLLKFTNAISIEKNIIKTKELGKYLCLVMMREFYSGMDRVRAMFKE